MKPRGKQQKVSPKFPQLDLLKSVNNSAPTAILGAGITGLCIAHSLTKAGQKCHLIENSHHVGGAMQSTLESGYLAEDGPNSILLKDQRVAQLLDQIDLGGSNIQDARPDSHNRFIVHQGELCQMPTSPLGMLRSPLFGLRGLLQITKEPFISRYHDDQEESFADFVRRRLGNNMLENGAGPFISGIYAGDPERLSFRHAFPRLWNIENKHRSMLLGALAIRKGKYRSPHKLSPTRTISFRNGLTELPQALAKNLSPNTLKLSANISNIEPRDGGWQISWTDAQGALESTHYQQLVITAPHHRLSSIPLPEAIIQRLAPVSAIESPPVTSLVLGFRREQVAHPLNGFGMLIKAAEKSPLLGVLFSSSMFDGRAPDNHVTLTCMMGGTQHPEYAENSDAVVLAELKKLLGVTGTPTFRHHTHWQHAIPQCNLGYQTPLDALTQCEEIYSGLHFAGNYRGGISVTDCIINGLALGKRLSEEKG